MSQSPTISFENLENQSTNPNNNEQELALASFSTTSAARKPQASTRVSLLVEALVRSVVTTYESDDKRASRTYRRICGRLFRMGLIDESWHMVELEGARVQFEHAFLQLLGADLRTVPSLQPLWPGFNSLSQYRREFQEIEVIGGGGFGEVYKVKHRLDGTEYAIKKIPIHSEHINSVKTYLSEVKTFATLNHPNIVPYKAAWLEIGFPSNKRAILETQFDQSKISSPVKEISEHNKEVPASSTTVNQDAHSDFEIIFEHGSDTNSSKSSESPSQDFAEIVQKRNIVGTRQTVSRVCWATLYIQMTLCHGTLGQWLRLRHETSQPELSVTTYNSQILRIEAVKRILIQILKGLEYIHSKGVVHHDIKPSNIFVSVENGTPLVQLGDFGLACPLQCAGHGLARGTPLYAAPEQLAGLCDPKSDIYSVGLVLFELLEDFGTDMERTRRISELRRCKSQPIPANLEINNLVTAMVRQRPEERPSASILLATLETPIDSPTSQVAILQERLAEKDREITRLTQLLREHGVHGV